jgi:hypothetical protein
LFNSTLTENSQTVDPEWLISEYDLFKIVFQENNQLNSTMMNLLIEIKLFSIENEIASTLNQSPSDGFTFLNNHFSFKQIRTSMLYQGCEEQVRFSTPKEIILIHHELINVSPNPFKQEYIYHYQHSINYTCMKNCKTLAFYSRFYRQLANFSLNRIQDQEIVDSFPPDQLDQAIQLSNNAYQTLSNEIEDLNEKLNYIQSLPEEYLGTFILQIQQTYLNAKNQKLLLLESYKVYLSDYIWLKYLYDSQQSLRAIESERKNMNCQLKSE